MRYNLCLLLLLSSPFTDWSSTLLNPYYTYAYTCNVRVVDVVTYVDIHQLVQCNDIFYTYVYILMSCSDQCSLINRVYARVRFVRKYQSHVDTRRIVL